MEKIIVQLKDVHKKFGNAEVVKGINLDVYQGEFLTLLGPSGCGKTTTLRMIAGFEDITSGTCLIDQTDMTGVPPFKRPVNTVFQNYALFPHMNVYDNIAYGLKVHKYSKDDIREKVEKALSTVQLNGFEKRKISSMSGGQKQRVAIARAIVNDPKVLLLDEPLGALDFKLRKQMQFELKKLQNQLKITFIYVTHDQEEAMTMSDRIAVMNQGTIEQVDIPDAVYRHPVSRFTADFVGESNLFEAEVISLEEGICRVNIADGEVLCKADDLSSGQHVFLCIRPEYIKASRKPVSGFGLEAVVSQNICTGNLIKTIAVTKSGKELLISRLADTEIFSPQEVIYPYWDPTNAVLMNR